MWQSKEATALWNYLLACEERQGFQYPPDLREAVLREVLHRERRHERNQMQRLIRREQLTRHHWLPQANDDDIGEIEWVLPEWADTEPCQRTIWLNLWTHRQIHYLFGFCRREQIHWMIDVMNTPGSGFWSRQRIDRLRRELTGKADFPLQCQMLGPSRVGYWHRKFAAVWEQLFGRLDVRFVHQLVDVFYRAPQPSDPRFWTLSEVHDFRDRLLREQRALRRRQSLRVSSPPVLLAA